MIAGRSGRPRLRLAEHYDAELRLHDERLRKATGIRATDRVLDVGCGAGQSTRDAARAAASGSALGIDISASMIETARRISAQEGLSNAAYELGDAQVYPFEPEFFDIVISRFGTMFFSDPVAAFMNIARALRPGARLVMMVWQSCAKNEWATSIREALGGNEAALAATPTATDAFSLADPHTVKSVLGAIGFTDLLFDDVHESVYYGPDVPSAIDLVLDMKSAEEALGSLDAAATGRALERLKETITLHDTGRGVFYDSRAWIVTARLAQRQS